MIRYNILANSVGRAWGAIAVYLFVPQYLQALGIEAYGLVGFYATLLSVMAFADMGFTATLNREMARLSGCKDSTEEMRELLRTYETTYLCISCALSAMAWMLAPLIAEHWLRSKSLQPHNIAMTLRVMGLAIALQLPSGLYIGGLMGLQRQVQANALQIAWGVFRGVGAVLVLSCSPTTIAFALWQVISNATFCAVARVTLWTGLSSGATKSYPVFKWDVFRKTWRYSISMAGVAAFSTLLTQTDKLAVSKLLSLEMLGYYSVAGSLASVPSILASPIAMAVFPRLAGMVASQDYANVIRLYHRTCELVSVVIIPAGLTIALFASDFIFAWTGSRLTADRAGVAASLLVTGQLIQAIMIVPFYLALAHNFVTLNLQIGMASVVLVTPVLIYMITKYGLVGAGLSWMIMNLCTIPAFMYFLHRRVLRGELRAWALRDVGRPLLATLPLSLLLRWLLPSSSSRLLSFSVMGLAWGIAAASAALASPESRRIWNPKGTVLHCPVP